MTPDQRRPTQRRCQVCDEEWQPTTTSSPSRLSHASRGARRSAQPTARHTHTHTRLYTGPWASHYCNGCWHRWRWKIIVSFYRAMLCIRGTSHGPVSVRPSVRLSVTSRSSAKTAKHRITKTTPHDSPGTLVFWRQRSPRNSTGVTPYEGAECGWGESKSVTFDK